MQRWDHEQLGVFGIGADLDEAAWRGVFRQLVALGLVQVDHDAYGALRLTEASRPVLKGEQPVEMRRTAPRQRRTSASAPQRRAGGSRRRPRRRGGCPRERRSTASLLARLKAWRLAEARAQSVPAYVILHDATLAEIARRGRATSMRSARSPASARASSSATARRCSR